MAQSSGSLPADPTPTPGLPENVEFLEFEGWDGIDTKPPRPGVAANNCAWLDTLMPLGKNNIRAIPDCADAIYTAPSGKTITHYDSFGLSPMGFGSGPHMIIFLSDGSAVDLAVDPATTATLAPPGTFSPPSGTVPTVRQFGTQFLLIATLQSANAYWVWDGTLLYGAGSVGPEVDITDGGENYTSAPSVAIIGGSGSGAGFTATVQDGSVITVTPTSPGSGYLSSDSPIAILLFSGGGGGTSAYGQATVGNGCITNATIIDGGSGFTSTPTIVITDPTGTSANIIVTGISGGVITSLQVLQCGSGYTAPVLSTSGGGGSNFIGTVTLQNGVITGVTMTDVGSGYGEAPQVLFTSPTGSGASGTAILSGGTITGVSFGESAFTGEGYSTISPCIVSFTGGNGPASATVQLMPFGISGNSIEVYQSQVWIATTMNGVKVFFSAPESVSDFGPNHGGGVFPATQSNLRYQYTRLIQSNGFLYLIGDSSVNYISGVQTSGSPVVTTFSNLNVDPQIGSAWRDSCIEYSRAVMMANSFGVHAIYGGAVQKVSTPLDGVFNSGNLNNVATGGPSSAIATIFGVHVYVLLLPITDPYTGLAANKLFMWDGKRWWACTQRISMMKLATLEWGGDISAWGTDGTSLYQMFQQPGTATLKVLRSRLAVQPSIAMEKKNWMVYALWKSTQASTLNFTVDTENGETAVTQGAFVGNVGAEATWARSKSPDSLGFSVGFTMTSNGADFTLINQLQLAQDRRLKT